MKKDLPPSFVKGWTELESLAQRIKQWACPHCQCVGCLIFHGWLRGYSSKGKEKTVRAKRLFCSDRFKAGGCGRTVSIFLGECLRGLQITATALWLFVQRALEGPSTQTAWQAHGGRLSLSTGYRLWRRLQEALPHLRTWLSRRRDPPKDVATSHPLGALVAHLRETFGQEGPIAGLQLALEKDFFG